MVENKNIEILRSALNGNHLEPKEIEILKTLHNLITIRLKNESTYKIMNYGIKYNGEKNKFAINGILINNEIFEKELSDYNIEERENIIDNLIRWISENNKDKDLMIEDLKYLMSVKDKYVFSSILTNEYILRSDNHLRYMEICDEILKLNKEVNK